MPNTKPSIASQAALDDKLQRATRKCLVIDGFFIRWGNRFYCYRSRLLYYLDTISKALHQFSRV